MANKAKKLKLKTKYPKVELVKVNKNGGPVGANYNLYINGFKIPFVQHYTASVNARGVAQVNISMYADISTRVEKKTK